MFFKLHGCHVIERSVRSKVIVLVLKCFGDATYLMHTRKQVRVEDFGAVGAVESLDVAILRWLTRLNKLQLDLFVFGPKLHVVARILRPIIDSNTIWFAVEVNYFIQGACYPRCR